MSVTIKKHISKGNKNVPNLYRDATGTFYARKRFGNVTPRKSLGTDVESVAILKLYDALKEMEAEVSGKKFKKTNELVRDFYQKMILEKQVKEIKQVTLKRIDVIWRNSLEPYWGNLTPSEVHKDQVLSFMAWHKRHKPGVQFQNTFKYLGNIFRIMVESGAILPSQMPKLEIPKTEESHHKAPKGRYINLDEFQEIAGHLVDPYKTIISVAYYMGMRKMEIGTLNGKSLIKSGENLFIDLSWQDTKTGIPRTPPIPSFLTESILDHKKGEGYLFPSPADGERHITSKSIDAAWRVAKEKSAVKGQMRIHDLRHTCATNLVKENINPLIIATYLGMTIKTLQERYLKLKREDLLIVSRSVVDLYNGARK